MFSKLIKHRIKENLHSQIIGVMMCQYYMPASQRTLRNTKVITLCCSNHCQSLTKWTWKPAWLDTFLSFCLDINLFMSKYWSKETFTSISCLNCLCRKRGLPYLLYIALAHMHVPLAPPLSPDASAAAHHPDDSEVYTASLREMDSLVGAVKSISDVKDRDNTLIWFTG